MRSGSRTVRARAVQFASTAAALVMMTVAVVALAPSPATAAPGVGAEYGPRPVLECIIPGKNGTYQAVFGYEKAGGVEELPVGFRNWMLPPSVNGTQPTVFEGNEGRAVYVTPPIPHLLPVTWTLRFYPVTATAHSRTCGPDVSLPAEGNGVGAVLVLTGAVVISMGVMRVGRWRDRRRRA